MEYRNPESAWNLYQTRIGGSFRSDASLADQDTLNLHRSSVLIGEAGIAEPSVGSDEEFFLRLIEHVIQRGGSPLVPKRFEEKTSARSEVSDFSRLLLVPFVKYSEKHVFPIGSKFDSDAERQFWNMLQKEFPLAHKSVLAQFPIQALNPNSDVTGWCDFLIPVSAKNTWRVFELDGIQHQDQKVQDAKRDGILKSAGIDVDRLSVKSFQAGEWRHVKSLESLRELELALKNLGDITSLIKYFHLPSFYYKSIFAIAKILASAKSGTDIEIDYKDDLGMSEDVLADVVDFLVRFAEFWSLSIFSRSIKVNGREFGSPPPAHNVLSPKRFFITIESVTPEYSPYPEHSTPGIFIRSVSRPLPMQFLPKARIPSRFIKEITSEKIKELENVLTLVTDFAEFRPKQSEAVLGALSDFDSVVLLPTGSGKTLVYLLAGLLRPGMTVVIDPLSALIDDQSRRLNEMGIDRVLGIHSSQGRNETERREVVNKVASGEYHFLLMAPERMLTADMREALKVSSERISIPMAVLDEAHCISEWGHDFRTAYLKIASNLRSFCGGGQNQLSLLCLTGTASPRVLTDLNREISSANRLVKIVKPDFQDRPNLHFHVVSDTNLNSRSELRNLIFEKLPLLFNIPPKKLIESCGDDTSSGIIFDPTPGAMWKSKEFVENLLNGKFGSKDDKPTDIVIYSGSAPKDLNISETDWGKLKRINADRFISNEAPIMVATKAFGMGIDKPNVRWTVHLQMPSSIEQFAQEAGRAGRDGKTSYCFLISHLPTKRAAQILLENDKTLAERRTKFRDLQKNKKDIGDLDTLYYFHTKNFAGEEHEMKVLQYIVQNFWNKAQPNEKFEIPFYIRIGNSKDSSFDTDSIEKAIYRLELMGVIDDHIQKRGSRTHVVMKTAASEEDISGALLGQLNRLEPGKSVRNRESANFPSNTIEEHLAKALRQYVSRVYQVLEPARLRAIQAMYNLVASNPAPEEVRAAINSYLGEGELSPMLEEIVSMPQLDISRVVSELSSVASEDPQEWIGPSSRMLESYPDHPVLLAAAAIGEGARVDGDIELFATRVVEAFSKMDSYNVASDKAIELFRWMTERSALRDVRNSGDQIDRLIEAWEVSKLDLKPLLEWEQEVLFLAITEESWVKRANAIRKRRLGRVSSRLLNLHQVWEEDLYV